MNAAGWGGLVAKVERREAQRPTSLGARGALPREVGTLIPPPRVLRHCTLAPPAAPSRRQGSPAKESLANLGRIAPRERGTMSRHSGRSRPCASEPGIQTFSSAVQHV